MFSQIKPSLNELVKILMTQDEYRAVIAELKSIVNEMEIYVSRCSTKENMWDAAHEVRGARGIIDRLTNVEHT